MSDVAMTCRICHARDGVEYSVREMMFGTKARFAYWCCDACGCLQIKDIPADFASFYPPDYYSFRPSAGSLKDRLKRGARQALLRSMRYAPAGIRARVSQRYYRLAVIKTYFEECPDPAAPIIDIGAGYGKMILDLRDAGYRAVSGIDPFVSGDIHDGGALVVRKSRLEDVTGTYRIVSFHHVLEHLVDPLAALILARNLLAPGGKILVRVPVADSELFRTYAENWFQLDAPRHLHLFSRKSLDKLAADAKLRITRYWCDSTEWPFLYSDMYRLGVPMTQSAAYLAGRSATERNDFKARAKAANARGDGDQVAVVFEVAP